MENNEKQMEELVDLLKKLNQKLDGKAVDPQEDEDEDNVLEYDEEDYFKSQSSLTLQMSKEANSTKVHSMTQGEGDLCSILCMFSEGIADFLIGTFRKAEIKDKYLQGALLSAVITTAVAKTAKECSKYNKEEE